ncbi:hypothetical protein AN1V17_45030 [Vallitalea sediminicola]
MYSILIVDDEELIRQGIIAKLKYNNFNFTELFEAEDGEQALCLLKKKEPNIVITDIRMSNMNGIEFIEKAKEICRNTRFIIISGYAEFTYAEQAINMGVNGYLLKPIGNEEFAKTLSKVYMELDKDKHVKIMNNKKLVLEKYCDTLTLEQKLNTIFHCVDKEDLNKNLKDEKILSNSENNRYMLAIINIDGKSYYQSDFKYQDIDILKFSIINICNEIEIECTKEILNNLKDRNQILILFYHDSPSILRMSVDKFLIEAFSKTIKLLNISVTIGLSGVEETVGSKLYKDARETLNIRIIYGENKIYKHDNQSYNTGVLLPFNDLNLLQKSIERYDLKGIEVILRDIFSQKHIKENPLVYIRIVWFEIINILIKVCNNISMDTVNILNKLLLTEEILNKFDNINDIINYLYTTILDIFNLGNVNDLDYKSRMKLSIQYIEQHFQEQISVNDLAYKFDMNTSYFSTLFKKETGITVVKYLTDMRINYACKLLKDTSKSVVDISRKVGFEDSQYFFRVFKKVKEMTPLAYRNKKQWID